MEENLHKDNLENFFKETLDNMDQEASKDGWDLPSAQSWDKINAAIDTKTPKSFNLSYWIGGIAASLLFLALTYQVYQQNKQIEELNSQAQKSQEVFKHLEKQIQEKTKQPNPVESVNDKQETKPSPSSDPNFAKDDSSSQELINSEEDFSTQKTETSTNTDIVNTNTSKRLDQIPNTKSEQTQSDLNNNASESSNFLNPPIKKDPPLIQQDIVPDALATNPVNPVEKDQDLPIQQQNKIEKEKTTTTTTATSETPFSSISLAEKLSIKKLTASNNHKIQLPYIDTPIDLPRFKKRFYLGPFIAPRIESFAVKGEDKFVDEFEKRIEAQNQSNHNWILGLNLGYQMTSNWSVESGLYFNKVQKTTTHPLQLVYRSANESINQDNELESSYDYTLRTSTGDIETDIALVRPNNPLQEGTALPVEVKVEQEFKTLVVPLLVKYQFGKRKFGFSIKTGVLSNFLVRQELSIQNTLTKKRDIRHRSTKIRRTNSRNPNKSFFDYQIALGVAYHLNKNWSLQLSPTFTQRLSPLKLKDELKVYPQYVSVQLGTNYYF